MNLCRNIHRNVWQLLVVEKVQNGGRCYGNQGTKLPPKYKNPPIWAKFGFQVDYDVANWYPSLVCYGGHFEYKMATKIQKSSDLGEIWFPSRLWCCELIFIVGLLWCSELDETFPKFCLTCVHIILRVRNFRMAAVATKKVKNLKCSELDET